MRVYCNKQMKLGDLKMSCFSCFKFSRYKKTPSNSNNIFCTYPADRFVSFNELDFLSYLS